MAYQNLQLTTTTATCTAAGTSSTPIVIPPRTVEVLLVDFQPIGRFYLAYQEPSLANVAYYLTGLIYLPSALQTDGSIIPSYGTLRFNSQLVLYPGCTLQLVSQATFSATKTVTVKYLTEGWG